MCMSAKKRTDNACLATKHTLALEVRYVEFGLALFPELGVDTDHFVREVHRPSTLRKLAELAVTDPNRAQFLCVGPPRHRMRIFCGIRSGGQRGCNAMDRTDSTAA